MTIGVTGGMGAGKSTVCDLFSDWGAERIDADKVGHTALEDTAVQEALVSAFGPDILDPEGEVDRRTLGQRAFVSDDTRRQLTDIVWPEVGRRLKAAVDSAEGDRPLIVEASVLLERGDPEGLYQIIVVVTAPEDVRVRRSMERLGLSEEEVRSRMRHQMPEDEKIKLADHVIVNDGDLDTLETRARTLWASLTGCAEGKLMDYTPHTEEDIATMLKAVGVSTVDDLKAPIPESLRMSGLDLPSGMTELEATQLVDGIAASARESAPDISFLGAGAYDHFTPSVVDATISRGEFFTAYTPYQPEVSQGTLRVIFEFQTMMCELTGMEVANASMYDGSSALAEAVMMAVRIRSANKVILPATLHPFYRQVVETYTLGIGLEIVTAPQVPDGSMDLDWLRDNAGDDVTAVVVQNPNFLGILEPLEEIGAILADRSPAFIAAVNPITLGLIEPPGSYGADIVVGEGQPLGLPLSFGGPYVGFFTTRHEHIRRMPGRIVGQTTDVNGKRAYVLTLKTREQDIRRDKATSNICTNQTLCGTAVTVYLSALGPNGLAEVGSVNWSRSHEAFEKLTALSGVSSPLSGTFFNEFVWEVPESADLLDKVGKAGISAGIDLGRFNPEWTNQILTCVTEKRSSADIDRLVAAVSEAI